MKIISGGQTGVDRAALDVAINLNLPRGGWCPAGRKAEDGKIPEIYSFLKETNSEDYSERTLQNIIDSDGTLILLRGSLDKITDGTILTIQEVMNQKRPFFIFDLLNSWSENGISEWVIKHKIQTLNIAGPRESQITGIYQLSFNFLTQLLPKLSP